MTDDRLQNPFCLFCFTVWYKVEVDTDCLRLGGCNLGKPTRFTAPTLPDGTAFAIHPEKGGDALFHGNIQDHVGDFTEFDPTGDEEYLVKAGKESLVPFTIGRWQLERITCQLAIDFMVDSRHYVGGEVRLGTRD